MPTDLDLSSEDPPFATRLKPLYLSRESSRSCQYYQNKLDNQAQYTNARFPAVMYNHTGSLRSHSQIRAIIRTVAAQPDAYAREQHEEVIPYGIAEPKSQGYFNRSESLLSGPLANQTYPKGALSRYILCCWLGFKSL